MIFRTDYRQMFRKNFTKHAESAQISKHRRKEKKEIWTKLGKGSTDLIFRKNNLYIEGYAVFA